MNPSATEITIDNAKDFIGKEVGVSNWLTITQEDISTFGKVTRDMDPMHVDPEWASEHSPFNTTIAFGFQTLSMLTFFLHDILPWPKEVKHGLNYGFDKVRFLEPVPVNSRIRAHMKLMEFDTSEAGRYRMRINLTVEIEGVDKAALVADWIGLMIT